MRTRRIVVAIDRLESVESVLDEIGLVESLLDVMEMEDPDPKDLTKAMKWLDGAADTIWVELGDKRLAQKLV